jgi:hypothetical protein
VHHHRGCRAGSLATAHPQAARGQRGLEASGGLGISAEPFTDGAGGGFPGGGPVGVLGRGRFLIADDP